MNGKFTRPNQYAQNKMCDGCGKLFQTKREHTKTCSAKCRQRVSRAGRANKEVPQMSHIKAGRVTLAMLEIMAAELLS